MATIIAHCPVCGEVKLKPEDVVLDIDMCGPNFYRFACSGCDDTIEKPADERIVRLLMSGGVHARFRRFGDRYDDDAPPITNDEVLDFILQLERTDIGQWLGELTA